MQDYLFEELKTLAKKAETAKIPPDLKERITQLLSRLNRMAKLGGYSAEYETMSRYLDWVTSIPWDKSTKDSLDLENTRKVLDKNHYDLEEVKARVLEYLAMRKLRKAKGWEEKRVPGEAKIIYHAPILCFIGLQGIGKTTMAASIAESLGRKFTRISLGAIGTVFELRGKSKSLTDAEPGQIIKALVKTGVRNPLILLDELDKVSGERGLRADVMAALLEILDPEQNPDFRDHYLDYPFDLSEVMFICSANNTGTFSTALMDRLEIIRFPSYSDEEKRMIGKNYLLPKILKVSGLSEEQITIAESLWPKIIRPLGYDPGIRSLQRTLEGMARKVAREVVGGKYKSITISEENVKSYLPTW